MAYTKHTWETGELITATKMNNIEEGIEQCALNNIGGAISDDGTGLVITFAGSDEEDE